jgi:hypothetical protein
MTNDLGFGNKLTHYHTVGNVYFQDLHRCSPLRISAISALGLVFNSERAKETQRGRGDPVVLVLFRRVS